MRVEEFIRHLENHGCKVTPGGSKQWNAQCPSHEDKSPSLRVSEGDQGRVLVKCLTGCAWRDVVRALGLKEEEMFQENKPSYKPKEPTRYELRDIEGALVAVQLRTDIGYKNKKFSWERNGSPNLGGMPIKDLPLYRSQDIPSFSKERPVFVTEGAKDCEALRALKLQALGTVTGAESFPSRQVLETLKGFWVVLWPDHDMVGYNHMRKIAGHLKGIAAKVSFFVPSSPNPKDGASDWVAIASKEDTNSQNMREALEDTELHSTELPSWEGEATPPNPPSEQGSLLSPSTVTKKSDQGPDLDHLAPLGSVLYTLESIDHAREKELLSLAELPSAEDGSKAPRYGWGVRFNDIIGGGLAPGVLVALGASSAGAGKTSFLMQLIDGLALRSALLVEGKEEGPLTPVFLLSEMSPEDLNARRLAWLTQERATTWRAGKTSEKKNTKVYVDGLYNHARGLRAETGTLGRVLSMSRQVVRGEVFSMGAQLVPTIRALVSKWRSQLEEKHSREVWPVVVFDPIQRFLRQDKNEIEAQNELVRQIDAAAEEDGWLCFLTSDTNKSSAKGEAGGDAGEVGATLFRGSYALIHGADIGCYLGKSEAPNKEAPIHTVPLKFFKNRSGPGFDDVLYHWEKATGRFKEFSHDELEDRQDAQHKEKTEKETKKKTKTNKEEVYK
jgi:hypothetical protein